MEKEIIEIVRHIFAARIDHSLGTEACSAWSSARDIFEYALENNYECLSQFDYLETLDEFHQNLLDSLAKV